MSALLLVLGPIVAAIGLALPWVRARANGWLVITTLIVASGAIVAAVVPIPQHVRPGGMVRMDATARLFLSVVDPIFLGVVAYFWRRPHATSVSSTDLPRFVAASLVFLGAANAVLLSNDLQVCLVALEITTLLVTPLIAGSGTRSARLASFHYLVFSSVGLGLVLLGFACIARGMLDAGQVADFHIDALVARRHPGTGLWSGLGLCLVLLGLGTKLGLVPMYTWLPAAYDEAPPTVAAMLAAVQFNCAFVLLVRVVQIWRPDHAGLILATLMAMGVASMVVSTVSIIATFDLKRLIAYASINHAGVLAIGLGLGRPAAYGMLLYALSNAFIKAILFLTAGKIHQHYQTKDTRAISGLIRDLPYSGLFLMLGTFALLGFPPFGSFFGELLILSALVGNGQMLVFATFCTLIAITFVATGRTIFPMIWGEAKMLRSWPRQTLLEALPKLLFLIALVVLGLYIPAPIDALLRQVAAVLEGS